MNSNVWHLLVNLCGIELELEEAREIVYGMPYAEWKSKYQMEASAEQKAKFDKNHH